MIAERLPHIELAPHTQALDVLLEIMLHFYIIRYFLTG